VVEDYPIPQNFHATALEWAGALRAVLDATTGLVAAELGAGWGPWLVSLCRAAQLKGIQNIRLLAVEGSTEHYGYLLSHFADNGLDPREHTLLHGVVGTRDGVAEFPVLADPSSDWGSRAIYAASNNLPGRGLLRHGLRTIRTAVRSLVRRSAGNPPPTERVQCFALPTLLRPFPAVDVITSISRGMSTTSFRVLAKF
jgi:hypothetical protein